MSVAIPFQFNVIDSNALNVVMSSAPISSETLPKKIAKRLKAVWIKNNVETDIGIISGFTLGTSFSGTNASLTIAWPDEKNPRNSSSWQNLLVPADDVRLKIIQVVQGIEIPLVLGVPQPNGINETYGQGRELVEIKIGDVTGVASRRVTYPLVSTSLPSIDAELAASTVLSDIEHVTLYNTAEVDACLEIMPNALAAADEVLINEQKILLPLTNQKRIRYGDRNGKIIYRIVEDPAVGASFSLRPFVGTSDFTYTAKNLLPGLAVTSEEIRFAVARLNPFIELGSRLRLIFPRAGIDEVVEVRAFGYRVMPSDEKMTITGRRELTL